MKGLNFQNPGIWNVPEGSTRNRGGRKFFINY
jgi:hypothetical protein